MTVFQEKIFCRMSKHGYTAQDMTEHGLVCHKLISDNASEDSDLENELKTGDDSFQSKTFKALAFTLSR